MCDPVSEMSPTVGMASPAGAGKRADAAGRIDLRLDGDAHRVAGSVDPGRDQVGIGGELREPRLRVDLGCAAHQAASSPMAVETGAVAALPSDQ